MRLRIWQKLFIALLAASTVVVIVTLLLTRASFNRGFVDYLNTLEEQRLDGLAAELASLYAQTGSWDALRPEQWREFMNSYLETEGPGPRGAPPAGPAGRRGPAPDGRRPPPPDADRSPPPPRDRLPPEPGALRAPAELLDADAQLIFGGRESRPNSRARAIELNGELIGYLRYVPITAITAVDEIANQQFLAQQRQAAWGIALVALAIAAVLALWLARQLVAPVRALTGGARALAAGRLDERILVQSSDELGELANDFNTMAAALEQNQAARRQWIVDISHELRTPLAILRGELQALEDGVRQWQSGTRESLQAEVDRLAQLVDDLHELSLSDAGGMNYHKGSLDLAAVVDDALDTCRTRIRDQGLTLETELADRAITVTGDARRLTQLVINLVENSCRYTDAGGTLRVHCHGNERGRLVIEDSAPGVPAEALPRLFDRLYRVEASRNRATGGSGLGLAICRGIVEAHGGTIHAQASTLGGLRIDVELPLGRD